MLIFKAVVTILLGVSAANALNDPCSSLECEKPEIACIRLISGEKHATFKCECAVRCENVNIINVPVVQRMRPAHLLKKLNIAHERRPTLKQGGSACHPQPDYCMNGGTCYTQYTQAPVVVPTTQASSVYTVSANSTLPPAYAYSTDTVSRTTTTTTTTTTTMAPTTTRLNSYITQPVCGCQPAFTGDRCEQPITTVPATTEPTTVSWNNLCKIYADRNMNICQNGGQCVFISDGKVACVCPSMYVGQYCETPVYTRCLGTLNTQCHRDYGTCQPDGSCLCQTGYCGMSCDQLIKVTTPTPSACLSYACQNGGTCQQVNDDPYVVCLCPSDYTGTRCETPLNLVTEASSTAATGATAYGMFKGSTRQPRCNFTIGVSNDGAFTARFRVVYSIDGEVQPELQSSNMPWIGQKRTIEIPHFATDIHVYLERLGFYWSLIHEDTGISTETYCTKCYKVWGAVTHPKWDYLQC